MGGTYRGYTEAQKRATAKYKESKYKRIPLDVKTEEYEALKKYADDHNEKVNGVIRRLIKEELTRNGVVIVPASSTSPAASASDLEEKPACDTSIY
jgi:hypothetical protein